MDNKGFLGKRRDRAIATILGFKEDECDYYLPEDVSRELRAVILDNINDVCDLAFDLMDENVEVNQLYLDILEKLEGMQNGQTGSESSKSS